MRAGLREEFDGVLATAIDEKIAEGMTPEAARRAAILEFGNPSQLVEACHDEWGGKGLEQGWMDLKAAIRRLAKSPGFTGMAIATLGLCVGTTLTIYAIIEAVIIRPLPYPDPTRLVEVYNINPGAGIQRGQATIANYFERRRSIEAFESLSMYRERMYTVGEGRSSRRVVCAEVTPEFFHTLGVRLAMGEPFSDAHFDFGPNLVTIITDEHWRVRYNSDPNVLVQTIVFNGFVARIIGVLPPGFQFLNPAIKIYRPLANHAYVRTTPGRHTAHARTFDGLMVARLKENATLAAAETQVQILNRQWLNTDPMGKSLVDSGFRTRVAPLHDEVVRSVKPMLLLVQIGVILLLVIAAINLASLQLLRASALEKETATRKAIGASRWQIARVFLLENTVLSLFGGLVSIFVAAVGLHLVRTLGTTQLPLATAIRFDQNIVWASLSLSILIGIGIALPIIVLQLRTSPRLCLQSSVRGETVSRRTQQIRNGYITTQIALALVLLCGAGLLGASLNRMLSDPMGFTSEPILTGQINLTWNDYPGPAQKIPFVRRLLDEIQAIPGITHVAISSALPFTDQGAIKRGIQADGAAEPRAGKLRAHHFSQVSPDYWRTMGIPLLKGRLIDPSDVLDTQARDVAVIDEVVAQTYWPNQDPVGKQFTTALTDTELKQRLTVVGVVGSVKQTDLAESATLGAIYQPYWYATDLRLLIRASVPLDTLLPGIKARVRALDPAMPIENFKTLKSYIDESLANRRSPTILLTLFAAVAVLLAAIGIYGVIAYSVSQRRREIGIRMALGAQPNQIRQQFMGLGIRLLVVGLSVGAIGAWAMGSAMQSILFHVPSFHLPTIAAAAALLTLVTFAACLLPALRSAHIDPMTALRSE